MGHMIDTHIHLDDEKFKHDLESVLHNARCNNVRGFIIPGAEPETLERAIEISETQEDVYFASGVHPCSVEKFDEETISRAATKDKCVAIGECGLDYFRLPDTKHALAEKERQKKCLVKHIEIALDLDLPLILHVRESSDDVYGVIKDFSENSKLRGVIHCFNADEILLSLSDSFYYGIGGICTFKNAQKIVDVLPRIPLDRILLETDGPYLSPTPHRGKRNESKFIPIIVSRIANILDIDKDELIEICLRNSLRLFERLK